MRFFVFVSLCFAVAAAGGVAWWQAREAAVLRADLEAQRAERRAAEAEVAAARAVIAAGQARTAELEGVRAARARLAARVTDLEADLRAAIGRRQDVDALIEKTAAALRAERDRHNEAIRAAKKFMPEGVRVALVTLNEQLGKDGQTGLRFLKARKIEDATLHGVQLLDHDPKLLTSTLYLADTVTFDLDRLRGRVTLCLRGGHERGRYGRVDFPPMGKRLVVEDIDGYAWEARLPYLVTAHGVYPEVAAEAAPRPTMDPGQRASWKARVDALLATADTELVYRLGAFRDLESGRYTDALVLGYDGRKRLAMSAEAARVWFRVDDRAESVELVLEDGILRRPGGDRPIPAGGFRIRLHGVAPERAREALLGMVKRQ